MQIQQDKYGYYHRPNGTTSLVFEVLITFFHLYLSNSIRCLSLIIFGYFIFCLTVVPNYNSPTILWYTKDMLSLYHTHPYRFFNKSSTFSDLTGHIFPSVPSYCISLISVQKTLHYRTFGTILVVFNVSPSPVHPIIFHDNRISLVHIHLYQIPFILRWYCSYVISGK